MDSTLTVLTPYGHDPNAYQASFYIFVRCRWLQVCPILQWIALH